MSLAITAVNDAPVATAQTDVAATEQTEVTLTLAGTDADSDASLTSYLLYQQWNLIGQWNSNYSR